MKVRSRAGWIFGALALVVFLGVVVSTMVYPHGSSGGDRFRFDPDVPDEYSFRAPDTPGRVRIGDRTFSSLKEALRGADPGDTLHLRGRLEGPVTLRTPGLTLAGADPANPPLLQGDGRGNVVTVEAPNVTLKNLWVRNSGFDPGTNDAGVWIAAEGARVLDSRITEITFGVWIDGVNGVRILGNTIVGRESVYPLSSRGNGIQIWKSEESLVAGNRITDVRDGIYYSWASEVLARDNVLWDLRYGVHYMYSDDCQLRGNLVFDSDSGYALMVSRDLVLIDNTAVNNRGRSGHGILLKSIDYTILRDNTLVRNGNGFYVYNSLDNTLTGNLVLENAVGVHLTAGSVREEVHHNSFIANGEAVRALIGEQVTWNGDREGNYWSDAHTADVDGDGISEIRHRPAGLVEQMMAREPLVKLFARSPAFAAIRLAQSSVPILSSPGVVDYHPFVNPTRLDWSDYYE